MLSLLSKGLKKKPCILLFGHDTDHLKTAYSVLNQPIPLFCIQHTQGATQIQIDDFDQHKLLQLDLNHNDAIGQLFKTINKLGYFPELIVYEPVQPFIHALRGVESSQVESLWQTSGLVAIHVAQHSIKNMLENKTGTLIFLSSGAHSPIYEMKIVQSNLNAGIRALSQSLAREFHPKGIHVVYYELNTWSHYSIESAEAIMSACLKIAQQPKSTWSQELTQA